MVDELHLVTAPTLAQPGRRLFDHGDALQRLELLDAERTPAGNLLHGYRVSPAE